MAKKRKLFDELMEGVESMQHELEGKNYSKLMICRHYKLMLS